MNKPSLHLFGSASNPRNSSQKRRLRSLMPAVLALTLLPNFASANQAGGGSGTGPNVTVVDNGDGTVTMGNGIATIIINKTYARVGSIKYTYNNNGTSRTTEALIHGSPGRESFRFGGFPLGTGTYVYSLATNPVSTGGNYGDVKLVSDSPTNGVMEAHFSMLRGSPGFYVTSINTHRSTDAAGGFGVFGINADVPSNFNWVSADPARNFAVFRDPNPPPNLPKNPVSPAATHEMVTDLTGQFAGQYDDKFMTAMDRADEKAFGWSSVGPDGNNIGVWQMTNLEYGNAGPLKRDVSVAPSTEFSNPIMTGEFSMGSDGNLAAGEVWSKTAGPFFVYLNSVSASITDATHAAQSLFNDATAQDAAEKSAWPYEWFNNPHYVLAAGRGTVTGRIQPTDPLGNYNPAVAGTWVGLEAQPQTGTDTYDFQKWQKPYQYWTQTDSGGNFTIPDVIAGTNYTLYAYGPGIAGTFMSQHQKSMTDGSPVDPPLEVDVPSPAFSVSVTAGQTTVLPAFKWTAKRIGPTVFELGYPNRKADKYRHGEDFWAPQPTPARYTGYPTGIWGGQMYFSYEFASPLNEVDYTVGTSRWATDWNYVLPSQQAPSSNKKAIYQDASGVITFNLADAPGVGDQASLYIACAGDGGGKIVVKVNNTTLDSGVTGVTASPNALSSTGFNPPTKGSNYQDDSSVHSSDHGPFFDERINFPASLLTLGANKITIINQAESYGGFLMVDYLRLELTNYVPPAPDNVRAFPGNNRNLITWPVVPGATRYALLRSTLTDSGYTVLVPGILGTVSGSGPGIMSYTDTSALNDTNYYYEVQSLNTIGSSVPSYRSGRATPSGSLSGSVPAAPALSLNGFGDGTVSLSWNTGLDVAYCNLYRTTLHSNGNGGTYPLRTILLQDALTGRSGSYGCTDTTPSNGTVYSYYVKAVSPAGTSGASASVTSTPQPPAPASAPSGLVAARTSDTSVDLSWQGMPNATGYTVYRSTDPKGPFVFPVNYVNATPLLGYTDKTVTAGAPYYYQVTAVNSAGISPAAPVTAPAQ